MTHQWVGLDSDVPPPEDHVQPGDTWQNKDGLWERWPDGKWHRVGWSRYVSQHDTWEPPDG
jgi:hypothetical protein